MAYIGSIELASGLKPKNNNTFPLLRAIDVYVDDDTRLDAKLNTLNNKITQLENTTEINQFLVWDNNDESLNFIFT